MDIFPRAIVDAFCDDCLDSVVHTTEADGEHSVWLVFPYVEAIFVEMGEVAVSWMERQMHC